MKIKRTGGVIAVAAALAAMSGAAQAGVYFTCPADLDRSEVASRLQTMAESLRCAGTDWSTAENPGNWTGKPIWQWGKKKDEFGGCAVHGKLAKLVYEARTSEPPKNNGKDPGGNDAQGAANDIRDGKDDNAILSLLEFISNIDNNAVLNESNLDAYTQSMDFRQSAQDAIDCVPYIAN